MANKKDYRVMRSEQPNDVQWNLGNRVSIHPDGASVRYRWNGDVYDHDMFLLFRDATGDHIDWGEDPVKTRPKCFAHLAHSRHKCPAYGMAYDRCAYRYHDGYYLNDHAEYYRAHDRSRIMISHPYADHIIGPAQERAWDDYRVESIELPRRYSWYYPEGSHIVISAKSEIARGIAAAYIETSSDIRGEG